MFNIGDAVTLDETRSLPNYDSYNYRTVEAGTTGIVTAVRSQYTVHVRFEGVHGVRRVETPWLQPASPEAQAAAAAEKARVEEEARVAREAALEAERLEQERITALMTPKEGDIMPDDPRLAWLWAKIEHDPEVIRYCSVYDQITDKLGIPGREREMSVVFKASGVHMSATVKARTPQEAAEKMSALVPKITSITVNGVAIGTT